VLVSAAPRALYLEQGLEMDAEPFDPIDGQWAVHEDEVVGDRFYQQRSITGDARSIAWPVSDDQIVETWVRVDQFAAGSTATDPRVGLIARYKDPANYYYVTLRRSNQVSLRRLVNGQVTVLGSAPLPAGVADAGRLLRLEVIGEKLRVYVDGAFQFETADTTFASGKAGLVTYRAAASFTAIRAVRP
jgi:hypothetical protein